MPRHLYLVRHGQMERNQPHPDRLENGLTPLGQKQAERTAQRLARLPITAIHHSTLRRAAETAGIIAARLPNAPLRPSRLLWEIVPSFHPSKAKYFKHVPPKVIERSDVQAARAFSRYFKPSKTEQHEVLVCHGNLIGYFAACAVGLPTEQWLNFDTRNCGVTEIVILPDGWMRLLALGDTGHLPEKMRTFL